jgi:hypothetical protein
VKANSSDATKVKASLVDPTDTSLAKDTFTSCSDSIKVKVEALAVTGSTPVTISLSQVQNTTAGTFNLAPATFTVTVNAAPVTNTKPALTLPNNTTEEATSASGAAVSYTATANDEQDGALTPKCEPVSGSTFPLGTTTVNCSVTDSGNLSASGSFTVTVVDTTAPKLTLPANITEEATGPSGNAVTYSASASDLVDGNVNVSCTPNSGSTFAIDTTTVNCEATDAAGNKATGSFTVKVQDTKAPTNIEFVGGPAAGGEYFFGDVPAAPTCTAVDSGSGLQGCDVTGYSTAVGTHTLTATATDKVGNKDTNTLSYTVKPYTFKGFYQPVDMGGVYNTVKGGSTVPLKFELFKGDTELTSTSYINQPLRTQKIDCASGAITDDIELLATGGTSLRYDSTGGQFIYNWKTPTGAGSCYKVTVSATDGSSSITALFRLK